MTGINSDCESSCELRNEHENEDYEPDSFINEDDDDDEFRDDINFLTGTSIVGFLVCSTKNGFFLLP